MLGALRDFCIGGDFCFSRHHAGDMEKREVAGDRRILTEAGLMQEYDMESRKRQMLTAVATLPVLFVLGGCSLLPSAWDTPSQDAITGDQSIVQPSAYPDKFGDDGEHFDSDGFLGGFSGTLGGR
jgi:hypothetical protein